MLYKVTLDAYPTGNSRLKELNLPPIPGTTRTLVFDTRYELGKIIWDGYQEMQRDQLSEQPYHTSNQSTADDTEIKRFRSAINVFLRFLAGEDRDNCNQVTHIEPITSELEKHGS